MTGRDIFSSGADGQVPPILHVLVGCGGKAGRKNRSVAAQEFQGRSNSSPGPFAAAGNPSTANNKSEEQNMKKKKTSVFLGILFGLLCLLFSTAAALGVLHSCDLLYRASVDLLDIPEISGYSREVIMRNYHDTMRYLSPFSSSEFALSDLRFSEGGAQHFADTKAIFNGVYIAGLISLAGIAAILFTKKGSAWRMLRTSAAATLAFPALTATAVAIDFRSVFLLFHKVFFSNDLWIFDPRRDEIIKILPQSFFMYCALFIVLFWVLAAAAQLLFYLRGRRGQKSPAAS
jgi:integral membrane protein (TIGR01906 family)